MRTFRFESGADPTRLVLVAAWRVAGEFVLPEENLIRAALDGNGSEDALTGIADNMVRQAAHRLAMGPKQRPVPLDQVYRLPTLLKVAHRVAWASAVAAPIRQHAQGAGTAAPQMAAWEVLVMLVVLVVSSLEQTGGDIPGLLTLLTELAGEVEDAAGGDRS